MKIPTALIYISFSIFILFFYNNQLICEENQCSCGHEFWIDVRAGAAIGEKFLNVMNADINLNLQISNSIFIAARGFFGGDGFRKDISGTTIEDFGGMLGYFSQNKDFKLTVAAGLSAIHASYPKENYFYTLGIPIEAGAYYIPHHIGFGVTIFDVINSKMNYYGINIGLQIRFY